MWTLIGKKKNKAFLILSGLGFAFLACAFYVPIAFWNYAAPTSAGAYTFTANTTITDANYNTYKNYDITVNTGVTLTFQTTQQVQWFSLTMNGTSAIVQSACTSSVCYPINIAIASNMAIASSAKISGDGAGYLGGNLSGSPSYYGYTYGNTTSGGAYYNGGSYGGYGGSYSTMNELYGSVTQPTDMGSGGGSYPGNYNGSSGGGAIKLTISGTLTLGGTITANGQDATSAYYGGCGSGGSVWINAGTISGSGLVRANGGGNSSYSCTTGGGGGGRVAIYYGSLTTFSVSSSTYVQALGGSSSYPAGSGTIYSKSTVQSNGDLFIAGTTVSSYGSTRWGAFGSVSSVSGGTVTMSTGSDPRAMKQGLSLAGYTIRPDVSQSTVATLSGSTATTLSSGTSLAGLTSAGKNYCVTDYEATFDNVTITGNQNVRVGCLTATTSYVNTSTGTFNSFINNHP